MKLTYAPSRDELTLELSPVKGKANKELGPFELWWDNEGNIRAFTIKNYTEELEEFKRGFSILQLGNIWRGIKIEPEDIQETRNELQKRLEEKH
jgi:hypothetical protein